MGRPRCPIDLAEQNREVELADEGLQSLEVVLAEGSGNVHLGFLRFGFYTGCRDRPPICHGRKPGCGGLEMEKPAQTDHPIHTLLAERWSPRGFDDRDVAEDQLASLMEAARWAASCFNEQPWSFLVARRSDAEEFQRMLRCLMEGNQGWAGEAPVLMITVARKSFTRNGKPNRHAWHDLGLAVGNMSIQATGLGLVLHQMAGFDPEQARKSYSIPEEFEAVTAIALGWGVDPDSLFRRATRA